ncbi:Tim44/TimA family putative adaptor protein [Pseudoblastomonas halimionae]|uniref:Tim44/TimA family putative adaptor protein n=1 Tax=Alteriqipengyuania halimionae TaxID=1926630 RepID=A0A6I4TZ39_9SPHN|nr:Tim44/TimA family putative adaptor protein [Alteriqipengyuania halimionae]MXP08786.1 Tim44/TimA family putative adaptor protein [Alteriqipengyuania halimionae]
MTVSIIILAMIAAFLGLRLYSVLGDRAEHEEEPMAPPPSHFDSAQDRKKGPAIAPARTVRSSQQPALSPEQARELAAFPPQVESGLRAISQADPRFDPIGFVAGAKGAYAMVLEAFWRGDREELRELCDDDVYASFAAALDAREEAGETLDNKLIRIEEANVVAADFMAPLARITVRFVSDIAAVTHDKDGNMIAGSLDDAVESVDLWTFSRDVTSSDPDWMLDETDQG